MVVMAHELNSRRLGLRLLAEISRDAGERTNGGPWSGPLDIDSYWNIMAD